MTPERRQDVLRKLDRIERAGAWQLLCEAVGDALRGVPGGQWPCSVGERLAVESLVARASQLFNEPRGIWIEAGRETFAHSREYCILQAIDQLVDVLDGTLPAEALGD